MATTGKYQATPETVADGQDVELLTDSAGRQYVLLAAGSASIGEVSLAAATLAALESITANLPAGELHVGEVGSPILYVTSTPTLSVGGAAATGDYVGTSTAPQAFTNAVRVAGGKAVAKSITIIDKLTTAAVPMELWLFSATFTAPIDNAAWSITDADALLCVGVIPIDASRWYASALNKVYTADDLGLIVNCAATSLFYALVARGTTPAWVTGDLQINLGLLPS